MSVYINIGRYLDRREPIWTDIPSNQLRKLLTYLFNSLRLICYHLDTFWYTLYYSKYGWWSILSTHFPNSGWMGKYNCKLYDASLWMGSSRCFYISITGAKESISCYPNLCRPHKLSPRTSQAANTQIPAINHSLIYPPLRRCEGLFLVQWAAPIGRRSLTLRRVNSAEETTWLRGEALSSPGWEVVRLTPVCEEIEEYYSSGIRTAKSLTLIDGWIKDECHFKSDIYSY